MAARLTDEGGRGTRPDRDLSEASRLMLLDTYRAMRAEIELRISNHTTLVSSKIVTTGVLLGFLLTRRLESEDLDAVRTIAFVLVPIIAFGYDAMIAKNIRAIHLIGSFVRDGLESRFDDLDLWETSGAGPDGGGGQSTATLRNYNKVDTRVLMAFTSLTVAVPIIVLWTSEEQLAAAIVGFLLLIGLKLTWNLLDDNILLFIAPIATAVVAVDIGGTTSKAALVVAEPLDPDTDLGDRVPVDVAGHCHVLAVGEIHESPSCADGERVEILDHFLDLVEEVRSEASLRGRRVDAVAVALPGPTYYDLGIPMMEHKFAQLRGVSLQRQIKRRLDLRSCFMNDAAAFAQGTWWTRRRPRRAAAVTLGTGVGAEFLIAGRPATVDDGAPTDNEIYDFEMDGGTLEDFVSARAISETFARASGQRRTSVAEIATLADGGDPSALEAFATYGRHLGVGLARSTADFRPEQLTFGGKVAAASSHFLPSALQELHRAGLDDVTIVVAAEPEEQTLMGVARHTLLALNRSRVIHRSDRHDIDDWRRDLDRWWERWSTRHRRFRAWRARRAMTTSTRGG